MTSPTLVLTHVSTDSLPSQQGQKGRPRKHGRVRVAFTVTTLNAFGNAELPPESLGERPDTAAHKALTKILIPQIAEAFGVPTTDVTFYAHESFVQSLSFIVKGTDKDSRRIYAARVA